MNDHSLHTVQMQQLLQRMRAGDDQARDELFRQTVNRLEHLARKMLRSFPNVQRWEQTDDVLQNALLRLLRSLQKLEPDSVRAFYGLAAQEIRRELLDLARHYAGPHGLGANQREYPSDDSSVPNWDPADPNTTDHDVERWSAFHQQVEQLPAELREVVSLVFYHGRSQAEVAELFQVNERTIRRRWQDALQKLRRGLQEQVPS